MVNESKPRKQERVGFSIQFVKGNKADTELREALEKIPLGKRQQTIKDWLRESQGFKTALLSDMSGVDHSTALKYLVDRMEWMEGQIAALHPYLEEKFANVSVRPASPFGAPVEPPQAHEGVSKETLEKRAAALKKGRWGD